MTAIIPNGQVDRLATGGSAGEDHARMHGRTLGVWENVMAHGAVGDGVTNDTAAIQAAIAATPVRGTVFFPAGKTFLISLNSIVFTSQNVMAEGAYFKVTQTGAGVAIDIGNGTSEFYNYTYRLGIVKYDGTGSGSSWQAGSVGVRTRGFYVSKLSLQQVYGFEKGLYMSAGANNSCDSAYGQVEFIDLVSNKVNLYIDAGTGNCFNNEISYFGARMGHSVPYGSNVTDCHHIKIVHSSNNFPNMHKIYNVSVEGDTVENYKTLKIEGSNNLFWDLRFESTFPGVEFVGAGSVRNWVHSGGYSITVTDAANYNRVTVAGNYEAMEWSGGQQGVLRLINTGSSAYPVIYIKDPGDNLYDGSATDYRTAIGADYAQFKTASDANPRFQVTGANGNLLWGDGTAALDTTLRRAASIPGNLEISTGGLTLRSTNGNLYLEAGKGLVNTSTGSNGTLTLAGATYGTYMTRNIADNNPVAVIDRQHASATGAHIALLNQGAAAAQIRAGTGSPEGVHSATVGSLFLRTDGGTSTTLYVKESGTGNTGWVAK